MYVPNIHTNIPLNTKYLQLFMQTENDQPLNQDYYQSVGFECPDYKLYFLL